MPPYRTAIDHPAGYSVQLKGGPLDFAAVTDHAVFLGILPAMDDPSQEISKLPLARELSAPRTPEEREAVFRRLPGLAISEDLPPGILDLDVVRSAWQEIIASAERNNEPGSDAPGKRERPLPGRRFHAARGGCDL